MAGAAQRRRRRDAAGLRAVLQLSRRSGRTRRRRPRGDRLQRGKRLLRRWSVRRVRPGVAAARRGRRPARGGILCGRFRRAAHAVAALLPRAFDVADLRRADRVPVRLLEYIGRGTVFVHADMVGSDRVWTGYWERSTGEGDEPAGILEEAPTWPDAADAVRWGRARTPRVVVVEPDGSLGWAGEGAPPAEIGRRWQPGASAGGGAAGGEAGGAGRGERDE